MNNTQHHWISKQKRNLVWQDGLKACRKALWDNKPVYYSSLIEENQDNLKFVLKAWMVSTFLLLNSDKIKVIVLRPEHLGKLLGRLHGRLRILIIIVLIIVT